MFILYRTPSPGEILNMFIPDSINLVYAAIVGMNCNVLCAFGMEISLLGSGCIVDPGSTRCRLYLDPGLKFRSTEAETKLA